MLTTVYAVFYNEDNRQLYIDKLETDELETDELDAEKFRVVYATAVFGAALPRVKKNDRLKTVGGTYKFWRVFVCNTYKQAQEFSCELFDVWERRARAIVDNVVLRHEMLLAWEEKNV